MTQLCQIICGAGAISTAAILIEMAWAEYRHRKVMRS